MVISKILIALFLSATIGVASTLDVGLVAHYKFDGDANDSSGNGKNATAVNLTSATGVNGSPNSSMYFNGSSYVSVSNIPAPLNNSFTWSLWVKTSASGLNNVIESAVMGNNNLSPYLGVNPQAGYVRFFSYDGTISGTANTANSYDLYSAAIKPDEWVMITVASSSIDNGRTFYINGINSGSYISSGYGEQIDSFIFGADRFSAQRGDGYLIGYLDNIRLYNRTLSALDVATIYAQEVPEPSALSLLAVGLGVLFRRSRKRD